MIQQFRTQLRRLPRQVIYGTTSLDLSLSAMAEIEELGEFRLEELRDAEAAFDAIDEEDGWDESSRRDEALEAVLEYRRVASQVEAAGRRFIARAGDIADRGQQLARAGIASLERRIEARNEYMAIQMPEGGRSGAHAANKAARAGTAAFPAVASAEHAASALPPGFGWIDLDEVNASGFIEDPAKFTKTNHAVMLRGIEILRDEIIPALRQGGYCREDAERIDRDCGTDYTAEGWIHPESRLTVWKAFLDPRREADVVAVERGEDGKYNVTSGRHRLGLARQLGVEKVPVRILGDGPSG